MLFRSLFSTFRLGCVCNGLKNSDKNDDGAILKMLGKAGEENTILSVNHSVNEKDSRPVSQVLSLPEQGPVIYLELRLPATTIGLPLATFVAKNKTSSLARRSGLRYTWPFNSTGAHLPWSPTTMVVSYTAFSPLPLARRLFSSTLLHPRGRLSFGRSTLCVAQTFLTACAARQDGLLSGAKI